MPIQELKHNTALSWTVLPHLSKALITESRHKKVLLSTCRPRCTRGENPAFTRFQVLPGTCRAIAPVLLCFLVNKCRHFAPGMLAESPPDCAGPIKFTLQSDHPS